MALWRYDTKSTPNLQNLLRTTSITIPPFSSLLEQISRQPFRAHLRSSRPNNHSLDFQPQATRIVCRPLCVCLCAVFNRLPSLRPPSHTTASSSSSSSESSDTLLISVRTTSGRLARTLSPSFVAEGSPRVYMNEYRVEQRRSSSPRPLKWRLNPRARPFSIALWHRCFHLYFHLTWVG